MIDFPAKFVPEETHKALRALVARAKAARARPEQFIELFCEDAVLHMVGDRRDCPFYGTYRGHEQILKLLRDIDAEFERSDHRILNLVIDGDRFALRRLVDVRHRGTAQSALMLIGDFVYMRDGLFGEVFEYSDTAAMRRLIHGAE